MNASPTTLSVLPPFTDTGGETEVGVGGGDSEAAVRYFSLILSASLEWPEETSAAVRTSQLVSLESFNHSCSRRACNVMCVCMWCVSVSVGGALDRTHDCTY